MQKVGDIRAALTMKFLDGDFVTDKTGVKCVEIMGANFIADEPVIFGNLSQDYIRREIAWYKSTSRYVYDIPGVTPKIWEQVADRNGFIHSNYGWCVWSADNDNQFYHCQEALIADKDTRRATMIYTRPSMQVDYKEDGMSDFMCTYATQYMIRDNKLHAFVMMRSNDAVFGYKNDYAWQKYVRDDLHQSLLPTYPLLEIGDIHWNAVSLHVYERHFNLIDQHATGKDNA